MRENWVGRAIDGFALERFLGGGSGSSVFLTAFESRPAAIKLVEIDPAKSGAQIGRWTAASRLSHPNLIHIFATGRGRIADVDVIYAVMEYAEENLAQVLRERPLSQSETREMLGPALATLHYLHRQGLVHSRLKPSNIMAAGDCLKISSDSVRPAGDSSPGEASPYAPPEQGALSAASDIWSLGVVLMEVLTRRTRGVDPSNLPEPFGSIAHHCLQPKPDDRWTASRIAEYLEHPDEKAARRRFPAPIGLWLILAVVAIGILGTVFRYREAPAPAPVTPAVPAPAPVPAPESPAPVKPAPKTKPSHKQAIAVPSVAPEPNQPLPEILPEARKSIRGRVRVVVKLEVDASGTVASATLVSHGSRYFDARSIEAAKRWRFPAAATPQQWQVEFEFLPGGTKAYPRRLSP